MAEVVPPVTPVTTVVVALGEPEAVLVWLGAALRYFVVAVVVPP